MAGTKRILITGAASGIGFVTAVALARRGHDVIATAIEDRHLNTLREIAEAERLPMTFAALDLRKDADIDAAQRHDPDIVVANAAHGESGPMAEAPMDRIRHSFETNLFGHIALIQRLIPDMATKGSGRVILLSSIAGRLAVPFLGPYTMTKFAIESLGDTLRFELAPMGIHVSLIEPGNIGTGFNERMNATKYEWLDRRSRYADLIPLMKRNDRAFWKNAHPPSVVARSIIHAVESRRPRPRYVTPRRMVVASALIGIIPDRWKDAILRRITTFR